eukprot:GFUD01129638.1.p1 GENE.GFUD01129638.1~~GFUD01129638.1.p1  ORF type:complete len:354 (-),score=103.67 GFUD01129638.1:184-1155(-)
MNCGAPHGLYAVLAVVRALLLKRNHPKDYQAIEDLMDHWEERRKEKGVVEMVRFMGAFCRNKLGMDWVTDTDVRHAFGVLKTNGVGHGSKKCFLYPNLSLISHSCTANLDMVDRPARTVQLVAKRMIKMGEELTWSYTKFMEPLPKLQATLSHNWMFTCQCSRCSDPSEHGLYFSSQKCDCGGYFTKRRLEIYQCDGCENVVEDKKISVEERNILKEVAEAGEDELADMIEKLLGQEHFHPTHHVMFRLYSRLLESVARTDKTDNLPAAVKHGETLLNILLVMDGEGGKIVKKCKELLKVIRYKDLVRRREEGGFHKICLTKY